MSARQVERIYTTREAAEHMRVSEDTIIRAIRATSGPVLRAKTGLGKGYRITASALEEWFEELPDA